MEEQVLSIATKPLPKQKVFLYKALYDEDAKFIWYVGGFGSGKSTIGCLTAIELCMAYPGNRGVIARSKYIDLRSTTMKTFQEIISKNHLNAILEGGSWDSAYNSQDCLLRFANGSEIYFWGLDYRSEEQLKSLEIGFFYLDEVNEIPEKAFTILRGRLRKANVGRRVGFITSNPEGMNWTYHYFVNHTVMDLEGNKRNPMDEKEKKKYFYIVAASDENTHLPQEYIDELNSYKGVMYRRYVKGEFASFAGQIYDQLEPSVHFIPRFEIPNSWYNYGINGAMDYGATNPTAVGRFAITPDDGFVILTDLFYQGNSSIDKNAPKIRTMFGVQENATLMLYADPSMFDKRQEVGTEKAISVADMYWNDHRIRLLPAKNDVIPGIELVKSYIQRQDIYKHPIYHTSPAPRFYIFDDLREAIDEMLGYHWNPEIADTPIKRADHSVDMIRYFLATSPLCRKVERDSPDKHKSDLDWIRNKQLQRLSKGVKFRRKSSYGYGNNFGSDING